MVILQAALSNSTKTYFSCRSLKYLVTALCFNTKFALWFFLRCFKELILLSTSWIIFLFHAVNSSVVTLLFVKIIGFMLESKPVSISLLPLLQFIDIASRKLGPWDQVFSIKNLLLF